MSQIQVDNIYNKEATGSPSFPLGANVTGVITATTFKGGAEITSGTISATSVTAASGTFNGPVTIGGTLTYEDVTNIDSVGVITARKGIKVIGGGIDAVGVVTAGNGVNITGNIGLGGATYGTSGQVLTSGGSGANATWTTISSAPEITATASGTVTAGRTMIINSNGTTSQVSSVIVTADPPVMEPEASAYELQASSGQNQLLALDTDSNKLFICWKYGSNDVTYGKIATINQDGTLTLGTTSTIVSGSSSGAAGTHACYVGSGKFMIIYRDQSNSSYATIQMISYNNDLSINVGNKVLVTASGSGQATNSNCGIFYDSSQDRVLMIYRQTGSSVLYCYHGVVDQTNINAPVPTITAGNYVNGGSTCYWRMDGTNRGVYDPDTTQVVLAYVDQGTGHTRTQGLRWNGSTNYTFASPHTVDSGNNQGGTSVVYDTDSNTLVYLFMENSNLQALAATVDTSGAFTFGTKVTVAGQYYVNHQTLASCNDGRLGVIYRDAGTSNYLATKTVTISGTRTLTVGSGVTRLSVTGEPNSVVYSALNGKIYYAGMFGSASQVNFFASSITQSDSAGYIGIANNSASNGQSVVIRTFGATNNNQSGLTAGAVYYIQKDGTIGTTADTPNVTAGIALNATTLLISR